MLTFLPEEYAYGNGTINHRVWRQGDSLRRHFKPVWVSANHLYYRFPKFKHHRCNLNLQDKQILLLNNTRKMYEDDDVIFMAFYNNEPCKVTIGYITNDFYRCRQGTRQLLKCKDVTIKSVGFV